MFHFPELLGPINHSVTNICRKQYNIERVSVHLLDQHKLQYWY